MSCLNISVSPIGKPMTFSASREGFSPSMKVGRKGNPMALGASKVGADLSAKVSRQGSILNFRCGLVCSFEAGLHLRVPQEHIWLLPENDFSEDVVVYANVHWTIE